MQNNSKTCSELLISPYDMLCQKWWSLESGDRASELAYNLIFTHTKELYV